MAESSEFGAELSDFRSRVGELRSALSLPAEGRSAALDAALFELEHAAEVLWPRYEELAAAARQGGNRREDPEVRLLRGLFQRLPLPVALLDRTTVVRRLNVAATERFGLRTGYATGRALTGVLAHAGRAAFRSQVAAVARGEGDRSVEVRVLHGNGGRHADGGRQENGERQRGDGVLRASLTALRPPGEPRSAVLAVFQDLAGAVGPAPAPAPARALRSVPVDNRRDRSVDDRRPASTVLRATSVDGLRAAPRPRGPGTRQPDLTEVSRATELMDLLDDMATGLLQGQAAGPETLLQAAARLLAGRFADWVVADLADGKPEDGYDRRRLWRVAVLGPDPAQAESLTAQDPAGCPLIMDAVRDGVPSLRVRLQDTDAFGHDPSGASVLVRAEVTSLLCVPLRPPASPGVPSPALGALTLFRTGGRRAFELAEAGVVDRMSRHIAAALREVGRPDAGGGQAHPDGAVTTPDRVTTAPDRAQARRGGSGG